MRKLNSTEVKVIFIFSGFLLGVSICLLIDFIIISANGLTFTISALHDIHSDSPALYFSYLMIPTYMFVGYLFSKYNIHYIKEFDKLQYSESKKNEAIKDSINKLTVGNLNTDIGDQFVDSEIHESLILLQKTLQDNRSNDQNRRFEDKQQNWVSEGIAQFGDILRSHITNFEELGYAVISNLVRYLDINQGGFFYDNGREWQ